MQDIALPRKRAMWKDKFEDKIFCITWIEYQSFPGTTFTNSLTQILPTYFSKCIKLLTLGMIFIWRHVFLLYINWSNWHCQLVVVVSWFFPLQFLIYFCTLLGLCSIINNTFPDKLACWHWKIHSCSVPHLQLQTTIHLENRALTLLEKSKWMRNLTIHLPAPYFSLLPSASYKLYLQF